MQGESFAAKPINISLFTRRRRPVETDDAANILAKINAERGNPHVECAG
jgi:hypothetical protein